MRVIIWLAFLMVLCVCPTFASTPQVWLELHLGDIRPGQGLSNTAFPGFSHPLFLNDLTLITNADIAYAQVSTPSEYPAVDLTFTHIAATKFCAVTSANIDKPVGVFVDRKFVNVAPIQNKICNGRLTVTGNFTENEAKRVAESFPIRPTGAFKVISVWGGSRTV